MLIVLLLLHLLLHLCCGDTCMSMKDVLHAFIACQGCKLSVSHSQVELDHIQSAVCCTCLGTLLMQCTFECVQVRAVKPLLML